MKIGRTRIIHIFRRIGIKYFCAARKGTLSGHEEAIKKRGSLRSFSWEIWLRFLMSFIGLSWEFQ